MKYYHNTRVFSRNIITDFVQGIRNFLGLELKGYSNLINRRSKEMLKEMPKGMKWYRIDIENLSGGISITVYGERK